MVFGQNLKILTSAKIISSERVSQGEQNEANFSFIAPSSEELRVLVYTCLPFKCTCVVTIVTIVDF